MGLCQLYNFLITSKPIMIYIMLYIGGIYTLVYIYPTDKRCDMKRNDNKKKSNCQKGWRPVVEIEEGD